MPVDRGQFQSEPKPASTSPAKPFIKAMDFKFDVHVSGDSPDMIR